MKKPARSRLASTITALMVPTIAVLTLVASPMLGCSKKEDGSTATAKVAASSLLGEQLLQKIPDSSAGFVVMDFSGDGYKRFNASPWANDVQGLSAIKSAIQDLESGGASEQQVQVAKTLLDSLQKLGLVSADGKSQVEKVVSSAVLYVSLEKGDKIPADIGLFARAAAGTSLTDRLPALKQILTDAGFTVSEEKIADAQGFAAKAPIKEDSKVDLAVHIAATSDKLGVAFTKTALEGLFGPKSTTGFSKLKALPEFAKAEESVRLPEAPLHFAFLSVKALEPLLSELDGTDADLSLKENPLAAVAIAQGYSGQMVTSASIVVSPTNDTQRSVLSAFEGSALPATAFKIPSDTAVSLSLDARVLSKLEAVLKNLDDASAGAVLQQIKDIQGLTLGLRGSDGSSPVPDLYLALDSSARERVASNVEAGVALGMMATGQQLEWLSKDIAGNPTRYIMTPLGVGLYVSSPKNSSALIVATSERAVQDLSTASSGTGSLDASMPRPLRDSVVASATAGSVYMNFLQLANLLDSVKGTISSMMGPSPELDQALDSTRLKRLGIGIGSLSYANGVFKIQSVVDRVEPR